MDMIEKYFMERCSTYLWVLEDYMMNPETYVDEKPPYNVIPIRACQNELKEAKVFMKMLNKYQRLKKNGRRR